MSPFVVILFVGVALAVWFWFFVQRRSADRWREGLEAETSALDGASTSVHSLTGMPVEDEDDEPVFELDVTISPLVATVTWSPDFIFVADANDPDDETACSVGDVLAQRGGRFRSLHDDETLPDEQLYCHGTERLKIVFSTAPSVRRVELRRYTTPSRPKGSTQSQVSAPLGVFELPGRG